MTEQIPKERFEGAAQSVAEIDRAPAGSSPPSRADEAAPKVSKRKLLLPVLGLAVLAGAAWYGYRYVTEWRFLVTTDDAYVKADMAILSARVAGHLLSVPVVENQSVKKGDVLAEIDPGDYKLAIEAAQDRIATQTATIDRIGAQEQTQEATVAQAHAQQAASRADQIRAASEFDRAQALLARNFATPQRVEQARADRDRTTAAMSGANAAATAAESNLSVLKAQRVEAERTREELKTALARAERDLEFTTVRAPFDGVVGNKAAQRGAYVTPGARLMAIVPLDTVYVEANYKETQLAHIAPGQKAAILVDAYGGRRIEGAVESLAPASGAQFSLLPPENATGNFTKIVQRLPVRVRVPAEIARAGILRPGLSVVVEIDTRDEKASR
ncbi:MAG: HlyD family secretion protein [Hyphomicrobiales bacterium]|nr:HlyD family secretion protein [Hyphomicrobiales bacterium]